MSGVVVTMAVGLPCSGRGRCPARLLRVRGRSRAWCGCRSRWLAIVVVGTLALAGAPRPAVVGRRCGCRDEPLVRRRGRGRPMASAPPPDAPSTVRESCVRTSGPRRGGARRPVGWGCDLRAPRPSGSPCRVVGPALSSSGSSWVRCTCWRWRIVHVQELDDLTRPAGRRACDGDAGEAARLACPMPPAAGADPWRCRERGRRTWHRAGRPVPRARTRVHGPAGHLATGRATARSSTDRSGCACCVR